MTNDGAGPGSSGAADAHPLKNLGRRSKVVDGIGTSPSSWNGGDRSAFSD